MGMAILGIGTAVPPHRISQHEAAEAAARIARCDPERAAIVAALYEQTDIAGRHMVHGRDALGDVLRGTHHSGSDFVPRDGEAAGPDTATRMATYEREALTLALRASEAALRAAETEPGSITHLVTVSCTGFAAPGFDIGLIKRLGLRATVARTHIGFMGCHGALNGLRVARAFTEADRQARVLLCAVELCSIHYHYPWDPKRVVGNALFADGAAALVAAAGDDRVARTWRVVANGSCLFPNSEKALSWTIGNHGFDMTLSTRVPNLIAANLHPWLEKWLSEGELAVPTVGSWAIHPGGPRVLSAVEDALGLKPGATAASRAVLRQFGNMSSPTVLFILHRLIQEGAPLPCVALSFGPGMVVEGALVV